MNKVKSLIPEFFLIGSTFYYWSLTALMLNWFAIVVLAILIFLVLSQHKNIGMVFSTLLIMINLYMVLALLSELNEFQDFNEKASKLLLFGGLFIGLNLIFSSLLLFKYAKKSSTRSNIISNSIDA